MRERRRQNRWREDEKESQTEEESVGCCEVFPWLFSSHYKAHWLWNKIVLLWLPSCACLSLSLSPSVPHSWCSLAFREEKQREKGLSFHMGTKPPGPVSAVSEDNWPLTAEIHWDWDPLMISWASVHMKGRTGKKRRRRRGRNWILLSACILTANLFRMLLHVNNNKNNKDRIFLNPILDNFKCTKCDFVYGQTLALVTYQTNLKGDQQ